MNAPWLYETPPEDEGILVASEAGLEWLLPWWWSHYQKTNTRPVAFVDFGLSPSMKSWCQKRGRLIPFEGPKLAVSPREQTDPEKVAFWELLYGTNFWEKRPHFFRKPLACLLTPFATTLWIDLDCEIRHSLDEIFAYKSTPQRFSISRDLITSLPGRTIYNSGVFLFEHQHHLIERWVNLCLESNGEFYGDQEALSHLLLTDNQFISELPSLYQWSHFLGENGLSRIVHWHGDSGKQAIAKQMALEGLP